MHWFLCSYSISYNVNDEAYHGVLSYSVLMLTYSLGDKHAVSCWEMIVKEGLLSGDNCQHWSNNSYLWTHSYISLKTMLQSNLYMSDIQSCVRLGDC